MYYVVYLDFIQQWMEKLFDLKLEHNNLKLLFNELNFIGTENIIITNDNKIELEILYNRSDLMSTHGLCLEIYRLYCYINNLMFELNSFIYTIDHMNDDGLKFFGQYYDRNNKHIFTFIEHRRLNKLFPKLKFIIQQNMSKYSEYTLHNEHNFIFSNNKYQNLGIIKKNNVLYLPKYFEVFIHQDYYYILEDVMRFTHSSLSLNINMSTNITEQKLLNHENDFIYKILLAEKLTTLDCEQILSKSFINKKLHRYIMSNKRVKLSTRMDNFKYLRQNMFDSMYQSLLYFDQKKWSIFEMGKVFYYNQNNAVEEQEMLGVLCNINTLKRVFTFNTLLNKIFMSSSFEITDWNILQHQIWSHQKDIIFPNKQKIILNLIKQDIINNIRTDLKGVFIFFEVSLSALKQINSTGLRFTNVKQKNIIEHENIYDLSIIYRQSLQKKKFFIIKDLFKNKITIEKYIIKK